MSSSRNQKMPRRVLTLIGSLIVVFALHDSSHNAAAQGKGKRGAPAPALTNIDAAMAFTCGGRNITVTGSGLQDGANVKLVKSGEPGLVIAASTVDHGNLQDNRNLLRSYFDIAEGTAGGMWSVVVTNPDGQSDTLTDALEVVPNCPRGAPGDLYVSNSWMWNILQFDGETGEFVCIFADMTTVFGQSSAGRTGEILWAPNGHLWVLTPPPFAGPSLVLEFDGSSGEFIRYVLGPDDPVPSTGYSISFGGANGDLHMQWDENASSKPTRRYSYVDGALAFLDIPLTATPEMERPYHGRFASNGHYVITGETNGSPRPTIREYDGQTFELRKEWIDNGDKRGFVETPDGLFYAVTERNLDRIDLYDVNTLQFVSTLISSPEVLVPSPCATEPPYHVVHDPELCWSRVNQIYDVAYGPNGHVFVVSRNTMVPRQNHVTGAFSMGAVHEFDPATGEQIRVIGRQDSFAEIVDQERDKLYKPAWLRFKPLPGDYTGVGTAWQGNWVIDEYDRDRFITAIDGSAPLRDHPANLLSFDMNRDGVVDCADWSAFAAAFEASSGYAPDVPVMCDEPLCPADITDSGATNGPDGTVNVFDLLELLSNWNTNGPGATIAEQFDVVDVFDLLDLLNAWGDC